MARTSNKIPAGTIQIRMSTDVVAQLLMLGLAHEASPVAIVEGYVVDDLQILDSGIIVDLALDDEGEDQVSDLNQNEDDEDDEDDQEV